MKSIAAGMLWIATAIAAVGAPPIEIDPVVAAAERERIEVVERVSRSTVAIFERAATNGGSGVIVSEDGLVVTNFHVTAPCGPLMLVGTNDGRVHEAVLLGLDPTGDIALVQLLGKGPWPAAELGDSDRVRVGDRAIVVGNPFLLAEDFTPSVSVGVISGVGRYQPPSGTVLEYADCLQTDAAINPGNSGGPLFDGEGRLIGINGRGSFEKRGRVNVGVGYAVSINQVKRFLSPLRAGRVVDHAALGATVVTRSGPKAIVTAIEIDSDAYRRGLRPGDEVVSLGGRDTPTANALLNAVGVLPAGWRVGLEYRHDGRLISTEVRLRPAHGSGELEKAIAESTPPTAGEGPAPPREVFAASEGYANGAAAERETERLLKLCRLDRVSNAPITWRLFDRIRNESVTIDLRLNEASWLAKSGEFRINADRDLTAQAAPPGAPPTLSALWVWRTLAAGEDGLLDRVEALGAQPWRADSQPADVLSATHRGLRVDLFFDTASESLIGIEASRDVSEDATRLETAFDRDGAAPSLRIEVGERRFADLTAAERETR